MKRADGCRTDRPDAEVTNVLKKSTGVLWADVARKGAAVRNFERKRGPSKIVVSRDHSLKTILFLAKCSLVDSYFVLNSIVRIWLALGLSLPYSRGLRYYKTLAIDQNQHDHLLGNLKNMPAHNHLHGSQSKACFTWSQLHCWGKTNAHVLFTIAINEINSIILTSATYEILHLKWQIPTRSSWKTNFIQIWAFFTNQNRWF